MLAAATDGKHGNVSSYIMKKLLITTFLLFIIVNVNGQYSANELLRFVIETKSLKEYNNVIVAKLDTSIVEFTLRNLKSNKRVFKSIDTSQTKITLTAKEKKFIINSFKKQYLEDWTNEDFANVGVIEQEKIKEYVRENNKNGYIYISSPIFIRNESVAIVFFANFYGDLEKSGGGINNLSFYKIENGKWKKWITLEAGIYN